MAQEEPGGFDTFFKMSLPHILEKIFLSLDYESFKTCYEVNKEWKEYITTKYFQEKAKTHYHDDIEQDQQTLHNLMTGAGNPHEVRRILSLGLVDVNHGRWPPLPTAIQHGRKDVVKILLDEGADPNKPHDDRSPLHWAALNERTCAHREIVKILLDRGAEPNNIDDIGETPLHWATYRGHNEVVKILLDGGADPNKVGYNERTPLYWAVEGGYKDMVRTLLDRGAEPDKTANSDIGRATELHASVISGNVDVVQLLLDAGAQPNEINGDGQTAAQLAKEMGHTEILEIIMAAGRTLNLD